MFGYLYFFHVICYLSIFPPLPYVIDPVRLEYFLTLRKQQWHTAETVYRFFYLFIRQKNKKKYILSIHSIFGMTIAVLAVQAKLQVDMCEDKFELKSKDKNQNS